MKILKTYISFLITIVLLQASISSSYGQIKRSQLIGSYIYNFANKISWPDYKDKEFNIVLISSNREIINEIVHMARRKKIWDKHISLTVRDFPDSSILRAQLILITKDRKNVYMNVFDQIEGKEILLVSENFDDKNYVMLNLYDTDDDKLLFEINKPNIQKQHLEISDEILLMGGTEIDIASVYLKSQHSLRSMEKQVRTYLAQLDSLRMNIQISNQMLNEHLEKIELQNIKIDSQKQVQTFQLTKIEEYKDVINEQINQLASDRNQLAIMVDSLQNNEKILQKRKEEMQNIKALQHQQMAKIDSINNEIIERNRILSDKDTIIQKQKQIMYLLGSAIFIVITLIIVILYAYYQNRKKSILLHKQRIEIERINIQLNKYNDELKTTLKEMQEMQQQLINSEKMASLGVLSAGIAHEINNPINFVYAGINSLLRDFEDIKPVIDEINQINLETDNLEEKLKHLNDVKKEYSFDEAFEAIPQIINDIKIGADRTAEIVKGLRTFSRSDKGEMKQLNVHEGIDTALLLLKNKYKNHVEIIKDYDPAISEISCYTGKINQVFLNVLSNAIDAIEEKGNIFIKTEKKGNNITISIKDSGVGMTTEQKEKLFDPFFTTKEVGKGTGLGLSITYGILKEHKGKIKVISDLGKGSEFIITLPINASGNEEQV